jgi:hypothetical protein
MQGETSIGIEGVQYEKYPKILTESFVKDVVANKVNWAKKNHHEMRMIDELIT